MAATDGIQNLTSLVSNAHAAELSALDLADEVANNGDIIAAGIGTDGQRHRYLLTPWWSPG